MPTMRVSASTFTVFAVLGLSMLDVVFAAVHGNQPTWRKQHRNARSPVVVSGSSQNITAHSERSQSERRDGDSKFSFYDAGLGACGKVNSASDYIVALNVEQWEGGKHCFEMITISFEGKTTQAQITDQCPGCPFKGLDMTRGLFGFFSSLDAGIIYGTWSFGGSAPPKDPPKETPTHTTTPKPKTTSTPPPPPPTTTSQKKTPTTSSTPPPTTTSSSSSSSSITSSVASTTSSTLSSSTTSSTPTPTPTLAALGLLNQAFVQLGELVIAGANASK